jgi:apolipoprotein D and lipocalin family protein
VSKLMLAIAITVVAAVTAVVCRPATAASGLPGLKTAPKVDLKRYMGNWHEIARLEHKFQKDCIGSSTEYRLRSDGEVDVINRCIDEKDGSKKEAKGRAWSVEPGSNSRLKVSFFWPFRSDCWIIEIGDNYEYSVVGSPDRKYLWVLAREPMIDEVVYRGILERLQIQGFPVGSLVRRPLKKMVHEVKF